MTNSSGSSKQARMREKAEEINLVLLAPDVDLWKLRELAISDGGLVNDTIRRRAWPKLVGLTSAFFPDEHHVHERKVITVPMSPPRKDKPTKRLRKGTAPDRVTNFGEEDNNPGTAFTGGPFDLHDTKMIAPFEDSQDKENNNNGFSPNKAALSEDDNTSLASFDSATMKVSPNVTECKDAEQIQRDVTRCTWHLLTGGQRTRRRIMMNKHRKKISRVLRRKQQRLGDLLNLTLAFSETDLPSGERLCYYQGYHDVASIFLAALGGASSKAIEQDRQASQQQDSTAGDLSTAPGQAAANMGLEMSSKVLYQVSLSHFREPMRTDFLQLQTALRMVLFPLLRVMDPEVHAHLYGCGMEPFFALSWLLTWFSHDIRDTALVKRLFDFFLVSHPLMPIYLSVAMLCHRSNRQEILSTPCEFAELHSVLAGLPKNSSMVGWKYRVGDGYVSDDEEIGDGETTSISLDSDMGSHLSSDRRSNQGHSLISGTSDGMMRREDLVLSEDHAHVVSMGIPAHVPFQELIDSAVSMMHRVPPRKIVVLSQRYFDELQWENMYRMYPTISFFHSPPSWAIARTAKADWVLKVRARERLGKSSKTRRDRRALSEMRNRFQSSDNSATKKATIASTIDSPDDVEEIDTPDTVARMARELKWPKAMDAQGFGPGEDELARMRKRRKAIMIGGAATAAIVVIAAIGIAAHHRKQDSYQQGVTPPNGKSFILEREQTLSYVKSAGMPEATKSTSRVQMRESFPTTSPNLHFPERNWPSQPRAKPNDQPAPRKQTTPAQSDKLQPTSVVIEAESAQQTVLRKVAVEQLKLVYRNIKVLLQALKAVGVLDPAVRQKIRDVTTLYLQQLTQKTAHLLAKIGALKDPTVRGDLPAAVSLKARQMTHQVTRWAFYVIKASGQQARLNLGGNNIEDLHLL